MTDEGIKKALKCCIGEAVSCGDCAYADFGSCQTQLAIDTLDYITRLEASSESAIKCTIEQHVEIHRLRDELRQARAENEDMHGKLMSLQAYIDNHEEIWKQNAEIDKAIVRKDTAKEILLELKAKCPSMFEGLLSWIDTKLKYYGVEVDDE